MSKRPTHHRDQQAWALHQDVAPTAVRCPRMFPASAARRSAAIGLRSHHRPKPARHRYPSPEAETAPIIWSQTGACCGHDSCMACATSAALPVEKARSELSDSSRREPGPSAARCTRWNVGAANTGLRRGVHMAAGKCPAVGLGYLGSADAAVGVIGARTSVEHLVSCRSNRLRASPRGLRCHTVNAHTTVTRSGVSLADPQPDTRAA